MYDQLKIRGVCKRWKSIIESSLSVRKDLVIFYRSITRPLVWFHSDRPVDLLVSVIVNETFKNSPLFERLFKCIKRLYFICRLKELLKSNFINFVNRFPHLEHFQVDTLADPSITAFRLKLKIRFNLPNLKSFCFNSKECPIGLVQLDCPKLEKLSVLYHFQLDEKCASFKESLKFLRVASFECKPGFELPNLEVLCCQNVRPIDISVHKKLKQIRYFYESFSYSMLPAQEPDRLTVLNGLFEQKKRLGRNDLQIYYLGTSYSPGPPEFGFKKGYLRMEILKSDLTLLQNGEDFKLGDQHFSLSYESEFDEKIARFDAQQTEKLARCLRGVHLFETLNTNPALNGNFKILFSYVQELWISKDIRTQSDLDRLPDLFPHLVELQQGPTDGIYQAFRNPSAHPDEFGGGPFNFRFLAKFKALHKLENRRWRVSPSELKEMMKSCRFLEKVEFYSLTRVELENGQVRTTLATYGISLSGNQFLAGAFEYEYPVKDGKETEHSLGEPRKPQGKFHSSEAAVDWLNQRGYLRKET